MEFDSKYIAGWVNTMTPQRTIQELNRLNKDVKNFCEKNGIEFLNANKHISWVDTDFADPMHFSDAGSQKFAKFLAESLIEVDLLSSSIAE